MSELRGGPLFPWVLFFCLVILLGVSLLTPVSANAALWYPIQPIPQGSTLYSVDCATYDCSAVGATGTTLSIRPASNGIMAANDPYGTAYIYANTYGNSNFLAMTSGNYQDNYAYALTSTNGYAWASTGGSIALNSDPHYIRDVIWTGTTYVSVGYTLRYTWTFFPFFSITYTANPVIATSVDGTAWTTPVTGPTYSTPRGFYGVASNAAGTTLVAVGGASGVADIYTSTDSGATWTAQTSPVAQTLYGVTWDGSRFIAVGANGTIIADTDGLGTWTDNYSLASPVVLNSVVSGGGMLTAVGSGVAVSSTDGGVNWTYGLGVADNLRDVVWDGTEMLAVGDGGAVLVSYNGLLWFPWDYAEPSAPYYYDVAYNGTNSVAVGSQGTLDLSTDNGVSWTQKGTDPGEFFRSVDWVPNLNMFVAVGYSGLINTSANGGVSWTNRTSGTTAAFFGVADIYSNAGGETIAAVGSGVIYTSPDGVTWTSQADPYSGYTKYAVAGSDTLGFVAVGSGNIIEHSPAGATQGVTWNAVASPVSTATWYGAHWYPAPYNVFIIVGTDGSKGLMAYSSNGTTWIDITANLGAQRPSSAFYGVGGQTKLIAVGTEGMVYDSYTCCGWSQVHLPTSATLYGVAETTTGHAITVGSGATIAAKLTDSVAPSQIVGPGNLTIEAVDNTPITASDPRIQAWLKQFYAIDDRDYVIFNVQSTVPTITPSNHLPITVTFSVSDRAANGPTQTTQTITTVDLTAPVVTAPVDIYAASTSVSGTPNSDPYVAAFLSGATATDNVDGALPATATGVQSTYPIGTTTVTFSATDVDGNTGTATANVNIWDAQAPVLYHTAPTLTLNATDPYGVPITDPYVQEWLRSTGSNPPIVLYDEYDASVGNAAPVLSHNAAAQIAATGNLFPIAALDVYGNYDPYTIVTFSAQDTYGNVATIQGTVYVLDISAPQITVPADISVQATSALGTDASNPLVSAFLSGASATDNVTASLTIVNDAPAVFPIGVTRVNFYATDAAGNQSYNSALVTVTSGTGGTVGASKCVTGTPSGPSGALPILSMALMLLAICGARRRKV